MSNNIISSLGAGSGIDVKSLVDGLVSAERASKDFQLDSRKEKLDAQISAYGTLKSSLSEFQGVLKPLANSDTFNARAVSFPDTDVITPTKLDADAQSGNYQIEVLSVAQSQSLATGAITDPKAALGAGEITFRFGAWASYDTTTGPAGFTQNGDKEALTITLDADDSLTDLVKKINQSDSGLQASVITSDGSSRLLLTAPSGANNALEITATAGLEQFAFGENAGFDQSGAGNFLQTQDASDASIKVNGLTVNRSDNEIDDVVQGLTFTVNKSSVGEKINFSISDDSSVGEQAIRDFVEGYNALFETMNNLTGTKRDEETNEVIVGGLATDGSAKTLVSRLRQAVTAAVPGLDSGDGFSALTNLGIRTKLDGTLEIVEKEFSAAIKNNFDKVGELFSTKSSSSNASIQVGYGSYVSKAVAGSYNVNITAEPAKGYNTGAAIVAGFPLDTGTGGLYSFSISVDGTTSNTITLPDSKSYTDQNELIADLQSLINGDSKLSETGAAVDVALDGGAIKITSRQFGSTSSVTIKNASSDFSTQLGLADGAGVKGKDVAGTIDGEAGFGSGNVLLPAIDSKPYGLNFTVSPGSLGDSTISFSRGLAGELSVLIDGLLANTGSIKSREDSINRQLSDVKTDREALDTKMGKFEIRLINQFLAMESIVSSFQSTGSALDGMLDRLPFTAQYK